MLRLEYITRIMDTLHTEITRSVTVRITVVGAKGTIGSSESSSFPSTIAICRCGRDTKTLSLIKTIDIDAKASPSGILVVTTPPRGGYHLLKKIPFGPAAGGGEYSDWLADDH
jgi:hypothetical protein